MRIGKWLVLGWLACAPLMPFAADDTTSPGDELAAVRAELAALPEADRSESSERRRLLERIEFSISRQVAAQTAVDNARAVLRDLADHPLPDAPSGEPIGPEEVDRLLADAIVTRRNVANATAAVEVLVTQQAALRRDLERLAGAERQTAERAKAGAEGDLAEERAVARLRVRDGRAALGAVTFELAAARAALEVETRKAEQARAEGLAAGSRPLDEAALEDYLRRRATTVEELTHRLNETMSLVAGQQQRVDNARAARDAAEAGERETAQRRVDAERAESQRLDVELRALRVDIEVASGVAELWRERAALMRDGSLAGMRAVEGLIERDRERLALAREFHLGMQGEVQTALDQVGVELRAGTVAGRSALEQRERALQATRANTQRALNALTGLDVFLDSSLTHIEHLASQQSALARLADRGEDLLAAAGSAWAYELFSVEDTIEVDGETIKGRLGVTVGKVVTALLVLTVGIWAASLVAEFLRRLMIRQGVSATAAALGYRIVNVVAIAVLAIIAFRVVNIPLAVFGFVGGALAIGVGLGAQNLVNNFISGIILLVERPIRIGDVIEIDGVRGTVRRIASRYSQIRRFDGVDILIPNRELLERQVTNLTLDDAQTRLSIKVGVAYGSPTRAASDAIMAAPKAHGLVLKEPAPFVLFEDFGESAFVFSLHFWVTITPTTNSSVIASDLRYMIERNLREAGIVIAFPQRDVHLDVAGPVQVEVRRGAAANPVERAADDA